MKRFYLFILIHFISLSLFSQYYSTGQDPASIRWKQIKTDKFRLIFPDNYESQSQYLANIMEMLLPAETKTLQAKVPRVPVLLHTRSAGSNGLTAWAPRRIELYPNPPQDSYAEEWLEQLAIHETRHAVQISKMNQGITGVLYYIFGEQATGGVLGLYIPPWFLEGDAVAAETALSKAGRGRTSVFENVLRAQLLEKGIYSYDKATLGSYKTFTPDAYELGYPFVAQVRRKYGPEVWNTALNRTAKLPFMIVPFSSGIKKETGLTKVRLYKETMRDLTTRWKQQENAGRYSQMHYLTRKDPENFIQYIHPVFNHDSMIIAVKAAYDDVQWLISINRFTGEEKKLFAKGYGYDESLSTAGDLVAWSEWQPDPRWQNTDYSVIRLYDISRDKAWYLTRKTRYFSPSISPEGNRISAVRTDDRSNCYIDILDTKTGEITMAYLVPEAGQVMTPVWAPDGYHLIYTLLTEKGKTLGELNLRTVKFKTLMPFSFTEVTDPTYYHEQLVLFCADYSGIQDIYALDTISGKIFQVLSSKFGSSDPDFTTDRKRLTFLDYTSDGPMIAETAMDSTYWVPLETITDRNIRLYETLAAQEQFNVQDSSLQRELHRILQGSDPRNPGDSIKATVYPVKKYSKWLNLFNPHSWAPASIDVDNMDLKPGISVLSQNTLNTSFTSLGYEYDLNEETGKFYAIYSYRGWYPVFNFRFDIGERAGQYQPGHSQELARYTYREINFQANASVPFNLSRGRHLRYLQPIAGTTYLQLSPTPKTPSGFIKNDYQTLDYRLWYTDYLISNHQDVFPRFGHTVDAQYRHTPFETENTSSIMAISGNLFLPGFIRHQGVSLYAGYQKEEQDTDRSYDFSGIISYPRGISGADDEELFTLMANYKFPVISPDLSIGPVFYIKRITLNLFGDYAEGKNGTRTNIYRSTGAELNFDLHILRFVFPFDLGVRGYYLPDSESWGFDLLYSVSF